MTREAITAAEVAEMLGVSVKTVYDQASRGRLPCKRLGRRVLFSRTAIMVWLGSVQGRSGQET